MAGDEMGVEPHLRTAFWVWRESAWSWREHLAQAPLLKWQQLRTLSDYKTLSTVSMGAAAHDPAAMEGGHRPTSQSMQRAAHAGPLWHLAHLAQSLASLNRPRLACKQKPSGLASGVHVCSSPPSLVSNAGEATREGPVASNHALSMVSAAADVFVARREG